MRATVNSQSARAQQLRARAASIQDDIDDMVATACRWGEQFGWDDPRLEKLDADIATAEALRDKVLARARHMQLHGRVAA